MNKIALRILPWVLVALGVLLYGREREQAGRLAGEVAVLRTQKQALERRAPVVRQEYIRDTITVTKTVTKYRTLVDSLVRTDTLTVREQIIVAAADTAIRACREVVSSCSKSLAIADSIHSVDQRIIRAYQHAKPSFLRRWGERAAWGAGGYLVGKALK